MNKLQTGCVKSNPSDSPLRGFVRVILPVANDGVTERRKLHSDLIL
jgi:hypothetical protein